jgi:DNA-binding NtrC family response regulator
VSDERPVTDLAAAPTDVTLSALGQTAEHERARKTHPTLALVWAAGKPLPPVAVFPAREPSLDIGRGVEGDGDICVLQDRRMSRHHARLTWDAARGELWLEDKSRRGTSRNGEPVDTAQLQDGDVVRMGDSFFVARWEARSALDASVPGVIGTSPAIRYLRSQLALVAPTTAWVLLLGETGTGKEVAARALHGASERAGPFVAVNCSAIPESLAESQLFGHKKGAFTGADDDHAGYFEQADGGTLFLDELGELSPTLQPKLLRALDERRITRLGETKPRDVDVRVVAATNRDLGADIDAGTFRSDLFARLADITLRLPPLRERAEDVVALLLHALQATADRLAPDLVQLLLSHPWPYNVRELFKVATELKVRGRDEDFLRAHLLADRLGVDAAPQPRVELRKAEEKTPARGASPFSVEEDTERAPRPPVTKGVLEEMMRRHKGNVTEVAREAGRSRKQVYRWLERFGVDAERYR